MLFLLCFQSVLVQIKFDNHSKFSTEIVVRLIISIKKDWLKLHTIWIWICSTLIKHAQKFFSGNLTFFFMCECKKKWNCFIYLNMKMWGKSAFIFKILILACLHYWDSLHGCQIIKFFKYAMNIKVISLLICPFVSLFVT